MYYNLLLDISKLRLNCFFVNVTNRFRRCLMWRTLGGNWSKIEEFAQKRRFSATFKL